MNKPTPPRPDPADEAGTPARPAPGPSPVLLPQPRSARWSGGRCNASTALTDHGTPGGHAPTGHAEGYRLRLTPDAIYIEADDDAGRFYAQQTLAQLRRQADGQGTLPCGVIEDWPDLPERGVMLDISRDKVPTMASLFALVDRLAHMKLNRLQLYMEHSFAYPGHDVVWRDASPMTPDQVRELDAYCRARHVELVPNQNCFGHLERWFKHDAYRPLAELPEFRPDDDVPGWYRGRGPSTLNPADPASLDFVAGLLDALLPCFTSDTINVGCDETYDLGCGRSRGLCNERGKGRVYLDFLLGLHRLCAERGRRMQCWGDIILKHPDLVGEVPGDVTVLDWGYEKGHPWERTCGAFAASGVRFQVAPSTGSFYALTGRSDTAQANQHEATAAAMKHGATGVLNTIWGDRGHWQPAPVDDPGLALGAALAWCGETNRTLDLPAALSLHRYHDPTGKLAEGVLEMGRIERDVRGISATNPLTLALTLPDRPLVDGALDQGFRRFGPFTREALDAARERMDRAIALVEDAMPTCPDAALLKPELRNAAALTRHAAEQLNMRLEAGAPLVSDLPAAERRRLAAELAPLIDGFRERWLARNRPGGLADSLAPLEATLAAYR